MNPYLRTKKPMAVLNRKSSARFAEWWEREAARYYAKQENLKDADLSEHHNQALDSSSERRVA